MPVPPPSSDMRGPLVEAEAIDVIIETRAGGFLTRAMIFLVTTPAAFAGMLLRRVVDTLHVSPSRTEEGGNGSHG